MVIRRVLVVGAAIALLAGCASSTEQEPSGSGSPTTSASAEPGAVGGNGSVYVSSYDGPGPDKAIVRYPVMSDGSLGKPIQVLAEPGDDITFPAVVDGIGDVVVTGSFTQYWTTDVQTRDAATGDLRAEVKAADWCGGEGLYDNPCALLDATRLARTSRLGGEGLVEGTINISSLQDGSTLKELGPFEGLGTVLGTSDPDTLVITQASAPQTDPPESQPGAVLSLDVASGATTEIGTYPTGWFPICVLGTDSVLGYRPAGPPGASVLGPATIGEVSWPEDDTPTGCSADGQFLYVQHIPQPPGEEQEDTEAPNPVTTIDRITLSDGSRDPVATLDPGVWPDQATR